MSSNGPVLTRATGWVAELGRSVIFFFRILASLPSLVLKPRLVVEQTYSVGVLSLVIVVVAGLFVGMVLALSGYRALVNFGAEQSLGTSLALIVVRELGPVITGLLFAGRAGSALAAEIGLMKATDQLAAMEMMAINPLRRVMVPRFLGGAISLPLLTAVFNVVGLFGAHIVAVNLMGVDAGAFWQQIQSSVDPADVYEGITKSVVFGVVASLIAVWEGYNAIPTAEGVGRATTRTVVTTAIAVLILDFMITAVAI